MGKYPLSAPAMTALPANLQPGIAAARQHLIGIVRSLSMSAENGSSAIHAFVSSMGKRIDALANAWSVSRRIEAPRLQFPSSLDVALRDTELDETVIFASHRNTIVQQASQMEKLHASAKRTLDAADYALLRMRLELAEIAPGLVSSLPDLPVRPAYNPTTCRSASRSLTGTMPDHRDIAA